MPTAAIANGLTEYAESNNEAHADLLDFIRIVYYLLFVFLNERHIPQSPTPYCSLSPNLPSPRRKFSPRHNAC
jgi:hypothetical protein